MNLKTLIKLFLATFFLFLTISAALLSEMNPSVKKPNFLNTIKPPEIPNNGLKREDNTYFTTEINPNQDNARRNYLCKIKNKTFNEGLICNLIDTLKIKDENERILEFIHRLKLTINFRKSNINFQKSSRKNKLYLLCRELIRYYQNEKDTKKLKLIFYKIVDQVYWSG